MQISKVTLIASLAGTLALQIYAQPASPELQQQALELLRQTLSQNQQPATGTALPIQASQPVSSEQHQQALDLLRKTIGEEPAVASQPSTAAQPKKPSNAGKEPRAQKATAPAKGGAASAPKKAPAQASVDPVPEAAQPQPAIQQPTGPKTKQQRLVELFERYKADQITPTEYHAERAKILAEP